VSKDSGAIAGSDVAQDAARAYDKVRGASDIQFAPFNPPKNPPIQKPPSEPPEWLKAIGRFFEAIGHFLKSIFDPIGQMIGISWPVLQWILIGLGAIFVLFILYRLFGHLLTLRRPGADAAEEEWLPDREQAIALLDEADRLAEDGQFDAATRLLLQRSVYHIETARPGLLPPASTAREIAVHPAIPARAREAFAMISVRVERSLFALRSLDAGDWKAARSAYADFALARLDEGALA
jgi:hypothetical protein